MEMQAAMDAGGSGGRDGRSAGSGGSGYHRASVPYPTPPSERAPLLAATQQALAQAAAHTTAATRSCCGPRDRGAGSCSTVACRRLRGWTA